MSAVFGDLHFIGLDALSVSGSVKFDDDDKLLLVVELISSSSSGVIFVAIGLGDS